LNKTIISTIVATTAVIALGFVGWSQHDNLEKTPEPVAANPNQVIVKMSRVWEPDIAGMKVNRLKKGGN
jgi:hypothetical protein